MLRCSFASNNFLISIKDGAAANTVAPLFSSRRRVYSAKTRHRKVTICPHVQVMLGETVILVVPLVTLYSSIQLTVSELTSVKLAAKALGPPGTEPSAQEESMQG